MQQLMRFAITTAWCWVVAWSTFKIEQASVSRAESRADPQLSTIRRHVEAAGGELVVTAVFDDKTVRLDV